MSSKLLFLIVFEVVINGGFGASTGNVVNVRPEYRISSTPIAQSKSSNNMNDVESAVVQPVKTQEVIVRPVVGVYGGYTGDAGPNPQLNTYAQQSTPLNGYNYNNALSQYATATNNNNPIFGVTSNGDFSVSAYFRPAIWGFVAGLICSVIVIWIANIFGLFELLGGTLRNIGVEDDKRVSGKTKKSLDLDQLSSLVYAAMDKYTKWNNKTFLHGNN